VVKKWCENKQLKLTYEDACKENALKIEIATEMMKIAKKNKLNRWEFPRNFYLSPVGFSIENNTLTPTFKIKKKEAFTLFKKEIYSCYEMDYIMPQKQ
jgi:long-chain acyl-CoA synthetase